MPFRLPAAPAIYGRTKSGTGCSDCHVIICVGMAPQLFSYNGDDSEKNFGTDVAQGEWLRELN